MRIKVNPNKKDLIAILPCHSEDGKLIYDVQEKIGAWHTELVYLAMEHGYEILDIFEVWHFPPSERSDTIMKGYMEFFIRKKQECEGWSKLGKSLYNEEEMKDLTVEKKKAICDHMKVVNGGFARPYEENVRVDPVGRSAAKLKANSLWGKHVQTSPTEFSISIYGYKQYLELMHNTMIDHSTVKFRQINEMVFKVTYQIHENAITDTNRFLNVFLASSVTAHAQVVLMRQMYVVGPERVLYCDTDSIICLRNKNTPKFDKPGLGNWENEHPKGVIEWYIALAPKCYSKKVTEKNKSDIKLKCKGVRNTIENMGIATESNIFKVVDKAFMGEVLEEKDQIQVNTMTIHPNSTKKEVDYHAMMTSNGKKQVRPVYTKRQLLINLDKNIKGMEQMGLVRLVPFGYEGEHGNI